MNLQLIFLGWTVTFMYTFVSTQALSSGWTPRAGAADWTAAPGPPGLYGSEGRAVSTCGTQSRVHKPLLCVSGPWGPPRHRGAAASCEAGPVRSEQPGWLVGPSVSLAHVSSKTEGTSAPADPSMSFQVSVLLPTHFKCLPSPG